MPREPVTHLEGPPPFLIWALCGLLSWLLLAGVVVGLALAVRALEGVL